MLKPIVIDGSNVALSHGNNMYFSCKGIRICVDWFKNRGHKEIKVFVPSWRKENARSKNPITNQGILFELEQEDILVFTPSRWICDKRIICYDDRYILKFAADINGIVVSNDNYRDIVAECNEFKRIVQECLLMYSFINDTFMPPDDPLGRLGPSLDDFLRIPERFTQETLLCPYEEKCTYGHKCKYRHDNDDLLKTSANHSVLRKTVSAPPYLGRYGLEPKSAISHPSYENSDGMTQLNNKNNKKIFEDYSSKLEQLKLDEQDNFKNDDKSNTIIRKTTKGINTEKSLNKKKMLERVTCKPLAKTSSTPTAVNNHEKLTRLTSAPNKHGRTSESEESTESNLYEKRKEMQFHLSYVFPKENVESIFRKFPFETDPNVLCEALLELNKSINT